MKIELHAYDRVIMQPFNIRFKVKADINNTIFSHTENQMRQDADGELYSGVCNHQIRVRTAQGTRRLYTIYSQVLGDRLYIKGGAIRTKSVALYKLKAKRDIGKPFNITVRVIGERPEKSEHKWQMKPPVYEHRPI
jgi:hypothetical protein